jgi:cell wall-associated NlpC family hydrolase
MIFAVVVIVVWGLCLVHRRKMLVTLLAATCLLALALVSLPGRKADAQALRQAYVDALLSFEGSPYVWGGENRFGIDCSGLVRKGLINANLRFGLQTLNPRLLRQALYLWWNDCTAQALRDSYLGLTERQSSAAQINDIDARLLLLGDLAVTAGGEHVLAFIGKGMWVEADPGEMRVIRVQTPAKNTWFRTPVHVVRWTQLR